MGTAPLPEGEPSAPPPDAPGGGTPLPVPELPVPELSGPLPSGPLPSGPLPSGPASFAGPVTDDDRQRFGVLLDRALERRLLDAVEYQRRLVALADATTIEELRDLVTELPALGAGLDRTAAAGLRPGGLAALGRPRSGTRATRRSPWPALVVVLVVLAVFVVVLAVVGAHLARSRQGSVPSRPVPRVAAVAVDAARQGAPTGLSPSHL
jgi:hypothetical protein